MCLTEPKGKENMNIVSKPTALTGVCGAVSVCRRRSTCVFSIPDAALNSHSAALMLLWQPAPMGHAIKIAPFLYSCILWTRLASMMNKTSVSVQQIWGGGSLHEDFWERYFNFFPSFCACLPVWARFIYLSFPLNLSHWKQIMLSHSAPFVNVWFWLPLKRTALLLK